VQPVFRNYSDGYGAELECPNCKGMYLHHEAVRVFECGEDEKDGLHVTIRDGEVAVDRNLSGNPSKRRHGLSIHFGCEMCDAKPILTIAQHKGSTLIDLRMA
jgi:hypothetical protein